MIFKLPFYFRIGCSKVLGLRIYREPFKQCIIQKDGKNIEFSWSRKDKQLLTIKEVGEQQKIPSNVLDEILRRVQTAREVLK